MGLLRRTSTPSLKTVTYLPPSTCHPKHVFKAILFGVATRLKRNCSEEIFLAERTAEYKGYLVNQGYPSKLVSDQFSKASAIPRNNLLRTRGKESKKLFPFVITFNPNLPDVGNIIRKNLFILQSNPKLKELFPRSSQYHIIFSSIKKSQRIISTISF